MCVFGVLANQVAAQQHSYDIIIRNGIIFDGLKTPRFVSDIGVKDGKVVSIGRIAKGDGKPGDLDTLMDVTNKMDGTTICALAVAIVYPVQSFIQKFPEDFKSAVGAGA